jgi:hypothetical protein
MLSREEYRSIQERIQALIRKSDSSIDPPELLARLRDQYGIPQGLGSTIMWEMIRAGYIGRSEGWRLYIKKELRKEAGAFA